MGFSAYILETLKRYGKADLGPLGSFILEYQPAKWLIGVENFQPPLSKLSWESTTESYIEASTVPQVISLLHDIPYSTAQDYFKKTVTSLNATLNSGRIDLGILGSLKKNAENQQIYFEENPEFQSMLKQDALKLKPLIRAQSDEGTFNWWLLVASALFLATFFWLIHLLAQPKGDYSSNSSSSLPSVTSIKKTNSSPQVVDTVTESIMEFQRGQDGPFIIITGTFCKSQNIKRMKNALQKAGYTIYEEPLPDQCIRIGVQLNSREEITVALGRIRKDIEPAAWVLDQ